MIMIEGHYKSSAQMELKSSSFVWSFALKGPRNFKCYLGRGLVSPVQH
jgi:hypothetical protein